MECGGRDSESGGGPVLLTMNTRAKADHDTERIRALTQRLQAEYAEMPGLSVTLMQAQRLLAMDAPTCAAVFQALIRRGVLKQTPQGRYIRA